MVYNEHKPFLHTLRFEDSWPFKEGRCSYQKVGHKTLLTNKVGCKIEWTSTPPTMTWHVGLIKSIYFTQNKRHWLFSFPSKLSEAKREEAEVQKAMEELKRKATLEEWGIFDKNVALPNLSETKHLRGLFSFEIRPNNFMWLVTRQFACSIKLPKGYSSSEPWGQNAAKGSELSRIEKQSECIWIIPFFCSWGSTIVVLPNRYTL